MTERYMYHCFPRRRNETEGDTKGLKILKLMFEHGLLLTPEVVKWKDHKVPPGKSEEYIQVSTRCCFTELSAADLSRHAAYFGFYALEYEHRALIDLGAMPVIYIPRMSGFEDYGVGPAFATQLAHLQELLARLKVFKEISNNAAETNPSAPVGVIKTSDGGLRVVFGGTSYSIDIPKAMLDRARQSNPEFSYPDAAERGLYLGCSAIGFAFFLKMLHWGIHEPDILLGTIKTTAGNIYPAERIDDPLLSYYQQREWRLLGGMLYQGKRITSEISPKLRTELINLDSSFFGRVVDYPTGRSALVDRCETYAQNYRGDGVLNAVKRVLVPRNVLDDARSIVPTSIDVSAIH